MTAPTTSEQWPVTAENGSRGSGSLTWKQTTVNGQHVVYGEAGAGPPVLFLHGWGLNRKTYKRALSRLANVGVRVLAPAMPGFGGTAALSRENTSLARYGDWAGDFLRTIEIDQPVLVVGHSFGGGVAIKLSHDHPQQVRSLVLVNSIGGSTWSRHGATLRSMTERPLWDWGMSLPAELLPLGQARWVMPVVVDALANLFRDPRSFWEAEGLARSGGIWTPNWANCAGRASMLRCSGARETD